MWHVLLTGFFSALISNLFGNERSTSNNKWELSAVFSFLLIKEIKIATQYILLQGWNIFEKVILVKYAAVCTNDLMSFQVIHY